MPDGDNRLNLLLCSSTCSDRFLKDSERILTSAHKDLSGISQLHSLDLAGEDDEAESTFQFGDLFAESWLCDSQTFGSPRKIELLGQSHRCKL